VLILTTESREVDSVLFEPRRGICFKSMIDFTWLSGYCTVSMYGLPLLGSIQ